MENTVVDETVVDKKGVDEPGINHALMQLCRGHKLMSVVIVNLELIISCICGFCYVIS